MQKSGYEFNLNFSLVDKKSKEGTIIMINSFPKNCYMFSILLPLLSWINLMLDRPGYKDKSWEKKIGKEAAATAAK